MNIGNLVRRHPFLFIGITISIIAFTTGFYTYAAIQKRLEVLIPAAIVFAALTWAGSGADFLGLLAQWYKDIQEDKKTPILEYDDVVEIINDYRGHDKIYTIEYIFLEFQISEKLV